MKLMDCDKRLVETLQNRGLIKKECLDVIEKNIYRLYNEDLVAIKFRSDAEGLDRNEIIHDIRAKKREYLYEHIDEIIHH